MAGAGWRCTGESWRGGRREGVGKQAQAGARRDGRRARCEVRGARWDVVAVLARAGSRMRYDRGGPDGVSSQRRWRRSRHVTRVAPAESRGRQWRASALLPPLRALLPFFCAPRQPAKRLQRHEQRPGSSIQQHPAASSNLGRPSPPASSSGPLCGRGHRVRLARLAARPARRRAADRRRLEDASAGHNVR